MTSLACSVRRRAVLPYYLKSTKKYNIFLRVHSLLYSIRHLSLEFTNVLVLTLSLTQVTVDGLGNMRIIGASPDQIA